MEGEANIKPTSRQTDRQTYIHTEIAEIRVNIDTCSSNVSQTSAKKANSLVRVAYPSLRSPCLAFAILL